MTPHLKKLLAFLGGIAVGTVTRRRRPSAAPFAPIQPSPLHEQFVARQEEAPTNRGSTWKRWIWRGALLAGALAVGGFLVAASGVVPIKASSGHWAVTRWFLQFSKSRSVATHTMGVKVPELKHERLVLKGAGHYETGCAPCHGSPGRARSAVADHMLPPPPRLHEIRSQRDPEELFYIIKHGIKFTGMPSWPSRQRDDEVWAMVAFILRLPELDGAGYQRLVHGEAQPVPEGDNSIAALASQRCARCHGAAGNGRGTGAFPKLAGQSPDYLYGSLQAYAKGERHSGVMQPVAAALEPEAMRALADYYSQLTPSLSVEHPDASFARGEAIVNHGIPQKRVPACAACHLNPSELRNPFYPNLAGQYPEYVELQLGLFRSRSRGGTAYAHIMQQVAAELTEEQIRDVAGYLSRTGPSPQKRE